MHVFALIEALTVTGPAKNLIQFATLAPNLDPPVQVTLLTFRRPDDPPQDPFLDACQKAGLAVRIIPERGPRDPRTISSLDLLIRSERPSILQTHSIKSHFLIRLSGIWRRLPWIAFHHGYTRPTRRQEIYNRLGDWGIARASRCVTVTQAFVAELQRAGSAHQHIEVIANAIDTNFFSPAPARHVAKRKRILSIGRLSKEKAHADLVEAVALLGHLDLELVIVGEGPERANLAALAERNRVNLCLAGQVVDVRPHFSEADVFVLPSHSEGSSNVLIEAMAMAMPIVATSVGGIPDTVDHEKHALLVPPSSSRDLATAIDRFLSDSAFAAAMGASARLRAMEHHSPRARALRIAALYRSLL